MRILTLAILTLGLASTASALVSGPTFSVDDRRFDVQFHFENGLGGGSGIINTALGRWEYSLSITSAVSGSSSFAAFANYFAPAVVSMNSFAGTMPWGAWEYDTADKYASGDAALRVVSFGSNASGDGAFVFHAARWRLAGVPDSGSSLVLAAAAWLAVLLGRRVMRGPFRSAGTG